MAWLLDVRAQAAEAGECRVTNPVPKSMYVHMCERARGKAAIPCKVMGP